MAGSSLGTRFRLTSFGESHGPLLGVVLDGVPSGWSLDLDQIQAHLDRRRPGQSSLTTARYEEDRVQCWSGLLNGVCTGAPLTLTVRNQDARPADYQELSQTLRPSHADFTTMARYGIRDARGGGRSSARETVARVMAGAVAAQILEQVGIQCYAWVQSVGGIQMDAGTWAHQAQCPYSRDQIEASSVRCPLPELSAAMEAEISQTRDRGDSVGGSVLGWCQGLPAGLGDPVYDKLEADLAKAMMSINAARYFELGSGWLASGGYASVYNDPILAADTQSWTRIQTATNHAGGVLGGMSNGNPLWFRVGFKPPSTVALEQQSVDQHGHPQVLQAKGRHDPCVVPRAVPVVEAMLAVVVLDHWLAFPSAQLDRIKSLSVKSVPNS
ncbi:MAG: chorismate synthase [Bacteroidota bacterium]